MEDISFSSPISPNPTRVTSSRLLFYMKINAFWRKVIWIFETGIINLEYLL